MHKNGVGNSSIQKGTDSQEECLSKPRTLLCIGTSCAFSPKLPLETGSKTQRSLPGARQLLTGLLRGTGDEVVEGSVWLLSKSLKKEERFPRLDLKQ